MKTTLRFVILAASLEILYAQSTNHHHGNGAAHPQGSAVARATVILVQTKER
jgi:hypothetical protein